ncbi:MAG: hypothetical protein WAT92_13980 [Saprospiraceae bacterium]
MQVSQFYYAFLLLTLIHINQPIYAQICSNGVSMERTGNSSNSKHDQDGNYIVYENNDAGTRRIFLYNLVTEATIQVSEEGTFPRNPKISGDYIVWEESFNIGFDEISLYKISTNGPAINISNTPNNDDDPQIDGNKVVWEAISGMSTDIFMYNIQDEVILNLTNDVIQDVDPQVSGNNILWRRSDDLLLFQLDQAPIPANFVVINPGLSPVAGYFRLDGNSVVWAAENNMNFTNDIYLHLIENAGAPMNLTNSLTDEFKPVVNGDFVMWEKNDGGISLEGYQISTSNTFMINDIGEDQSGANINNNFAVFTVTTNCSESEVYLINLITRQYENISNCSEKDDYFPTISGNIISWECLDVSGGPTNIKYFLFDEQSANCLNATNISNNLPNADNQPQSDGSYIVWSGNDGNDSEIFLYNLTDGTVANISNNASNFDRNPEISGDYVVWEHNNDAFDDEILLYRISTNGPIINISNRVGNEDDPKISGNFVVWEGIDGTDTDIYLYNISTGTVTDITNDTESQYDPDVDGHYVVWTLQSPGAIDIFLFDANQAAIPANFLNITLGISSSVTSLHIDSVYVYWQGVDPINSDSDIFLYNIIEAGNSLIVSDNEGPDGRVSYNSNRLVWEEGDFSADNEIAIFDLETLNKITVTNDEIQNDNPKLEGDLLFWEESSCNQTNIVVLRLSDLQRFDINNCSNNEIGAFIINGQNLIFEGNSSGNPSEIFLLPLQDILPPEQAIPSMGTWAVIFLGLLTLIFGTVHIKQSKNIFVSSALQ